MRTLYALLLWVALGGEAFAAPITLTYSGFGVGRIGTTAFGARYTITAVGDTEDRILVPTTDYAAYSLAHSSASVFISGVGSFQFLTATRTFVNLTQGVAGFSRGPDPFGFDLFATAPAPALASWDMSTSIGPIAGNLHSWDATFGSVYTDAGILSFQQSFAFRDTFQAAVVPEPGTLSLLLFGMLGIAARRERRLASTRNHRGKHHRADRGW